MSKPDKLWKYIFYPLKWGNYGGAGWTSGKWCPPEEPDMSVPPAADALDTAFKKHDECYNNPYMDGMRDIMEADLKLIATMPLCLLKYAYGCIYSVLVMVMFICKLPFTVIYFLLRGML